MIPRNLVKRLVGALIVTIIGIIVVYLAILTISIISSYRDAVSNKLVTEESRATILDALNHYYIDHNNYPTTLNGLVPDYLTKIPDKKITDNTDWQYTSNGERYDFGYLEYPDTLDHSRICSYSSDKPEWICEPGNFGPFGQIPTPLP